MVKKGVWRASKFPSGIIWKSKTRAGYIYLYNKGWFRNKEGFYVVSYSKNGRDRKNVQFNTKAAAIRFAKSKFY